MKIVIMTSHLFLGLTMLFLYSSCNGNNTASAANGEAIANSADTLPPVETKKPNTDYQPAFAGQTRIAGMQTSAPYEGVVLTNSLESPWGIVSLPDGRFLITLKKGSMVIVNQDGTVGEEISGIPEVNSGGQGGLLGLALDPDFTSNRMVYWAFSDKVYGGNLTAVAKGRLSDDEKTIENAAIIYRATPAFNGTLHYGGRVIFDKKGNLYLSTGERSDIQTRPQAQQLNSGLGKIIRIDKEGHPASGNPFADQEGARPELWSYGHRNVQGLAFHPVTGDLWESEFGPLGGDEINRIQPGKNYGWPTITYSYEYSGKKIGEGLTQKEGMEQPIYYWDPVISPSGIAFYTGSQMPEWKNNLFVCALSGQHIARLRIENNKVVGEERLLADEEQRFRDITQGKDGNLYAITDAGRLYVIRKK